MSLDGETVIEMGKVDRRSNWSESSDLPLPSVGKPLKRLSSNVFELPPLRSVSGELSEGGMRLDVSQLNYDVIDLITKKPKRLLHGVTGFVRQNRFLAVMGNSGAGKTTFLNLISGQNMRGTAAGDIYLNGQPVPRESLSRLSAYIMQDDLLIASATPRESFQFSADLRCPSSMTSADKKERVAEIISLLKMEKSCDTFVGNVEMRGISGGERKRTNIGVELITRPNLLFVDEPTSGLDSFTALSVIDNLVDLSHSGRTVVCTIHQPSSTIFERMDDLLLLHSGRVVYWGEAKRAIGYFDHLGFCCPRYHNPADFIMEVLNSTPEFFKEKGINLAEEYLRSPMHVRHVQMVDAVLANFKKDAHSVTMIDVSFSYPVNPFVQVITVFKRSILSYVRDPTALRARIFQTILFALLLGLLYFDLKTCQRSGIQDTNGLLFFCIINLTFNSAINVVLTFPLEKSVFLKEHRTGTYRVSTYFMGKMLSDIPFSVLIPFVFTIVVYFMGNLRHGADHFFICAAALIMVGLVAQSMGLVISAAAPSPVVAVILAPLTIIPFLLVGGFFTNNERLYPYWVWLEYISFVKYGFEILMVNQWLDFVPSCPTGVIMPSGNDVLAQYSIDAYIWRNFAILGGMIIAYRLLALFALWMTTRAARA